MIALALHLSVGDEWVPATDVLRDDLPIRTDACSLSLRIDGVEHVLGWWNLGRVDLVTDQAEDCARRLRDDGPGLIRSAVLDGTDVPFHLFDPPDEPGGPAHISRVFVTDRDVERWFPVRGWSSHAPEELFDWIDRHRSTLLARHAAQPGDRPAMRRVPVALDDLLAELDALVAIGRQVLERADEHQASLDAAAD